MIGSIRKYDSEKKFGFIRGVRDRKDYFFHQSKVTNPDMPIEVGSRVNFEPESDPRGPQAVKVEILGRPSIAPYLFFSLAGVLLIGICTGALQLYSPLKFSHAYLLGVNLATFALFGYDKAISTSSASRVPESVLYMMALAGGSLGLFVSQQFFRHKTRKARFQFVLLLIFAIQALIIKLFLDWQR